MTTGTVKRTATSKWLSTSMLGGGALLCLLGAPVAAFADDLPTGGTVAAGAATIASNGQTTTVNQTTSRAVVNWSSFSVGQDKTVDFIQPDAQSATLNRVTGNTTSTIAGLVRSNGAVYLINPNGIAITASGAVQTGGGFVASTLDMADADFMAGKNNFAGSGSSAGVSNAGHITAGAGAYVALLGGSVSNSGSIAVPLGRVGLGSGESITLDLNGDGFMQVAVPTSALTGDRALIEHSGTISANGGLVMLSAATVKDAVRNVINLSGGISADSATGSGGRIILSGGDGGTVNATGTLSARATGAAGNGGLVETSGANVNFAGLKVDTSAAHGLTGTWLIDPTDLTVDNAAASTISTNLATSNVVLQTTASGATGPGVTSAGAGDINVNAAINWSSGNSLTLSAYRNININAAVTSTNSATVVLRADNSGTGTGSLYFSGSGMLNIQPNYNNMSNLDIYYNPTSYSTPTNFSTHISTSKYNAYMLVNTINDLQNINQNITGNYALGRDIDATVTASWNSGAGFVPLGTDGAGHISGSSGFTGHFNGNGYTISNLTIYRPGIDYVGLFGFSSNNDGAGASGLTDFQNINVINSSVTGQSYVGGIFGVAGGNSRVNYINYSGTVNGSTTTGSYVGGVAGLISGVMSSFDHISSSGSVSGNLYVGGLFGTMQNTPLTNSYSSSNVSGAVQIGGLIGNSTSYQITNVYATGDVSGQSMVGGLFGQFSGTLLTAYSSGTITVLAGPQNSYIGGLIGYGHDYPLQNVYSTSNINAPNSQYVGGLVGRDYQMDVSFGYYAGKINASGSQYVGALAGKREGTFTNFLSVFWDKSIIGNDASQAFGLDLSGFGVASGGGLTTAQLQDFTSYASTYTEWNFNFWSPPTQAGQAGQVSGYYPQLYALTPVVVATAANASRTYGAANPAFGITINAGGPLNFLNYGYVFGPTGSVQGGDNFSSQALASAALTSGLSVGQYVILGNSATSTHGVVYRVIDAGTGRLTVTPAALTVTYTANPLSRLYGSANPALTGTESATGLVNGDTLTGVTSGTAAYGTAATSGSNVGSYAINGSGLSGNSGNYTFNFVQAAGNATALSVTPAPVIVFYNADRLTRLYGAANPALTGIQYAFGLVNGDTLAGITTGTASYSTTATSASNVGSYAINGSGLSANSSNYTFTFTQVSTNAIALQINPAPLTITYTANPFSRTYGPFNPSVTGTESASGLVNGDTLASVTRGTASYTPTANMNSNVGTYGIVGSGLSANNVNYNITFVQAAGNTTAYTITQAPVTVIYSANFVSRLYGAANPAFTGSQLALGLFNNDTLASVTTGTATYSSTATSGSNVGNYAVTGTGLSGNNGNYAFTFVQANSNAAALRIDPAFATITYTANPFSRLYGAANPTFTGTVGANGLVNGDTVASATSGTALFTSTATAGSNIGSYAINGSGLTATNGNYTFTFVQAAGNATALSITPASLSVTADPLSRTYGAANPALTYSTTGLVNGDTLSGALATTATSGSNVGSYAITQGSLAASSNYVLTFTGASLIINPASLVVTYTADPFSRLYGAANPAFTGTVGANGLVNGDTLAGVTSGTAVFGSTAASGSNVGSYAVTGSGLSGNSGNYSFSFVQAAGNATALSVTPASATITYTANPFSRVYGAANPAFTGTQSATGLVNGDTLTGVTSGTAVYGSTATAGSNIGSYAITGSGLSGNSGNYSFTFVQAAGNATALTITPASLSVTANPLSRTYGAANPALTYSATGLVNGDTLSGALATSATSSSNVGTYAITQGSLAASSNYTLTFTGASLIINPAALSVTANPITRTYGAANPALTYSATGLVNGDTLSGALATTATGGSNVGTYAITQGSLAASSNYTLTFTGASLIINPAALTVTYTASPLSRIYGNANPAFTGTQSATGLVNGDTLAGVTSGTAVYGSTATVTSNVGSYAITGSGLSGNSGNYTFTFVQAAGNATALSVTPRALSVTANPISRQFGVPNPPLTYVVGATTATSGLVNGDVLTGALTTSATQSSPSGDYQILQGTLAASSNYTFTYTGAVLKIALPPLQSLSSFVAIPSDLNLTFATEQSQGCTGSEVSESMRETGSAKLGDGSGSTSCK